ncbi:MAG TPA: mannonate dehydratase [Opitutaceae bacterium]|nr:mannonate dehydratase [Opitutaceae bacterium]
MNRREFLQRSAVGGAALGLGRAAAAATPPASRGAGGRPVLMKVGHQHDHAAETLRHLAALGVNHICSGLPSETFDEAWSVGGLTRLRRHVESFGVRLEAVPLPMSSHPIETVEFPDILLGRDPQREREIDWVCQMIRNCGRAGIPMVKYNLTMLGVVRTGRVPGRGGASYSSFDYRQARAGGLTAAGPVSAEVYWDRIEHFLRRVVPAAEEARVKIALHPNDPGLPADRPYEGVWAVLSNVAGLQRFVQTVPSDYHGLNFCQGTVAEMLANPGEELYDVIRWFGQRKKIFNVHFRNIAGRMGRFSETFPDNGDVDMPRALRAYREVGFDGMVMPDHVPRVQGDDPNQLRAFSFCFGYIRALLQAQPPPGDAGA